LDFGGCGTKTLNFAISKNNTELLKAGANPDSSWRIGPYGLVWKNIALVQAAEMRNAEIVQKLLEAGANPNPRERGLFARNFPPLSQAVGCNNTIMVHSLLNAGADPNRDVPPWTICL
jgi:ankyrin repeat protein